MTAESMERFRPIVRRAVWRAARSFDRQDAEQAAWLKVLEIERLLNSRGRSGEELLKYCWVAMRHFPHRWRALSRRPVSAMNPELLADSRAMHAFDVSLAPKEPAARAAFWRRRRREWAAAQPKSLASRQAALKKRMGG